MLPLLLENLESRVLGVYGPNIPILNVILSKVLGRPVGPSPKALCVALGVRSLGPTNKS